MKEHFFQCPFFPITIGREQVSMLIDFSQNEQNYVEDCEVCCNPIQLKISIKNQQIIDFSSKIAQ